MGPEPQRPGEPLVVLRRTDDRVVGDGVAVGAVAVVPPLVDLLGPGFRRCDPLPATLDMRHAARRKDPQHLILRDWARRFGHDQVDEVLRVGQPVTREPRHRHRAVGVDGANVLPGPADLRNRAVETVDEVAVIDPERRGQFAVATAQVDDEPALDARGFEDLAGLGVGFRGRQPDGERQRREQHGAAEQNGVS